MSSLEVLYLRNQYYGRGLANDMHCWDDLQLRCR